MRLAVPRATSRAAAFAALFTLSPCALSLSASTESGYTARPASSSSGSPVLSAPPGWAASSQAIEWTGADFAGGAADLFGGMRGAELNVNYVYARSTGPRSTMRVEFNLPPEIEPLADARSTERTESAASSPVPSIPTAVAPDHTHPLFLYMKARDDDFPSKCNIAIELNGRTVFAGRNDFPDTGWRTRRFDLPQGALRPGPNVLVVANREPEGRVGWPPWFMVARCAIAPDGFSFRRDLARDFRVELPPAIRPLPEPLAPGQPAGFAIRGIKGWMWTPAQYMAEIPVLARHRMNFLMNCYTSLCDVENHAWGDPEANRWWENLPAGKKRAYERIVRLCERHGVAFCFSMNPALGSKRPIRYDSARDVEDLWKHYDWMQRLGVRWFNLSLDDIQEGIEAEGQARLVNEMHRRLRAGDRGARLLFTPTIYWGDGSPPAERAYLETLAKRLDPEVILFWTGDAVTGRITRAAAESYRRVSGHRLFLWDNYPVNDGQPTMHLGPVTGRDADLPAIVEGYMANSMRRESESNRIPVLTAADYAFNPAAYDPARSIGQAILHLEKSRRGREALRSLVERYPGFLLYGPPNTGINPVREQFRRIVALPHGEVAAGAYCRDFGRFVDEFGRAFPRRYRAEKEILRADLAFMDAALSVEPDEETLTGR